MPNNSSLGSFGFKVVKHFVEPAGLDRNALDRKSLFDPTGFRFRRNR